LQTGAPKLAYPEGTLDFFALVCLDLDLIYIVPIEELIGRQHVAIYTESKSRLDKFREDWGRFCPHILTESVNL
jgi:hypothetical protein